MSLQRSIYSRVSSGPVWSDISYNIAVIGTEHKQKFRLTKDITYLALMAIYGM